MPVRRTDPRLTPLRRVRAEESDLSADLVSDRLGDRVPLEPRGDWSWRRAGFPLD